MLARANPLSPPPGLPRFPGLSAVGTTQSPGTATSPQTTLALPALGRSQRLTVISGTIRVRLVHQHRFLTLTSTSLVPVGSEVDTTDGRVLITTATRVPGGTVSAEVHGGRFVIEQQTRSPATTTFTLSLPLSGCARAGASHATEANVSSAKRHAKPTSRRLWVSEHGGAWGTNGRYVSTTVEGTRWLTVDECTRSEVKVEQGKVRVRDLVRKKTLVLTAGKSYAASRRG